MDPTADAELLSRFAREDSEAAFRELVARHFDLVYSAALRQLNGDAPLAQDVAQTVFTELARQARSLPRGLVLAGWLHRVTHFAAVKAIRGERRRHAREQEAVAMHDPTPHPTPDWEQLGPVLDTALGELTATDRDAVLLRFFERKDFRAVGAALGLSEDAAQKRVARALDKLRTKLTRRGVTLSGSALAATLTAGAVHSAPAGLAAAIATASLAGASAAAATGFAAHLLQFMTPIKIKLLAAAVAAAAIGTPLVGQHRANESLRAENAALREHADELEQFHAENQRLAEQLKAEAVRPQAEQEELARLRGQLTALRRVEQENAVLKAQRENLAKRDASRSWKVGAFVPSHDWRNVGLGTPEDAFQTLWWARKSGDTNILTQMTISEKITSDVTPDQLKAKIQSGQIRLVPIEGASVPPGSNPDSEAPTITVSKTGQLKPVPVTVAEPPDYTQLVGGKFVYKQQNSPPEVQLNFEELWPNGQTIQSVYTFRLQGNEWEYAPGVVTPPLQLDLKR